MIVDIADTGNARAVERLYGRVLSILAKRYGSPSPFELGRFAASVVQDVNAGRLIRIADWRLAGGGVMRVGIPQRLDRRVRIEVQVGSSFPSPRVTRWSFELVR